jgi:hypothetical protein
MEIATQPDSELLPPTPIRVETALSRYPVHRLAKRGTIAIDIRERGESGEITIKWEVSHNSKYGQPGPLAYKLDTLIINRRIEEACRPIPRLIRLGSLRDICRELGLNEGQATQNIKNALYQNAFAGITAKTQYRQSNGTEKTLEAGFTRYNVVFTGEKLPNGRKADAVYIVLSDIYMQVINGAMTRPLDYDYLKSLPPAPQRFYELLSYQMYAAIKNDRARAKLVYSEFCSHAPQTRHLDWEGVRSQMNKVHRPHRNSGYIAKVDYEQTTDGDGNLDWIMFYQPGPKARAEYRAFAKRGGPVLIEVEPFSADTPATSAGQALPPPAGLELSPLEKELIGHRITPVIASVLVRDYDAETIRHQIEILDWMQEKKPGKITEPGGWLVSAIKTGHAAPKGFTSAADRQKHAEARRMQQEADIEASRRKQQEDARRRAEQKAISGYWDALSKEQQAAHDAAAIAQADAEELKLIEPGLMKRIGMGILRDSYTRKLLQAEGKLPPAEV